jgi:hypothetical protein
METLTCTAFQTKNARQYSTSLLSENDGCYINRCRQNAFFIVVKEKLSMAWLIALYSGGNWQAWHVILVI